MKNFWSSYHRCRQAFQLHLFLWGPGETPWKEGGVIIVDSDNVVRSGLVADPEYTDEKTKGVRSLLKAMEGGDEVEATTIATVGEKGFDGLS